MTVNQEKSGEEYKKSPAQTRRRTAEVKAASVSEPNQADQPAAPKSGELAVSEFGQIVNLINTVSVTSFFKSSEKQCPDKPIWCLPDVNCTARVTLSQDAIAAFKDNQEFCEPVIIVD